MVNSQISTWWTPFPSCAGERAFRQHSTNGWAICRQLNQNIVITVARSQYTMKGYLIVDELQVGPTQPESYDGFEHSLRTMLAMMWDQAPGFPTGNHGLFHRYHIEAVTLQGYRLKGTSKRQAGFVEMGRYEITSRERKTMQFACLFCNGFRQTNSEWITEYWKGYFEVWTIF